MTDPVLVACAHGTRNPTGRRLIAELALAAKELRPGLVTTAAFVDVQPPTVVDVVAGLAAEGRSAVVVPLLLSGGYHVHVDIAGAVAGADGTVAARPLGPDPRLAAVLLDRLVEAGADPQDPGTAVVVAAAGSSDERAVADVEHTAALLQHSWAGPVTTGYGSAAQPPVPDAVTAARDAGAERVVLASYLLAPGHFHDKLAGAGADLVTAPLLPDPRIAAVLLDRYDAAVATTAEPEPEPEPEPVPAPAEPAQPAPTTTPSGGRRWNRTVSAMVTAGLALALGFGLVVQIRSTGEAEITGATEEDLVRILDELDTREEQLRSQLAEREQAVEELSGTRNQSGSALAEAQRRAETIGILNGTLPARGPGLRLVVEDPDGAVTAAVLLDAIQELRGAGAEAIEVDGVRVVVSSYVGGTPGELTVDGRALEAPYEVLAIGPPTDLEVALNVSGGVVADVARTGGTASVTQSDDLTIDSLVRRR